MACYLVVWVCSYPCQTFGSKKGLFVITCCLSSFSYPYQFEMKRVHRELIRDHALGGYGKEAWQIVFQYMLIRDWLRRRGFKLSNSTYSTLQISPERRYVDSDTK